MSLGSLTLLSVRGRKSEKIYTIPVALVEQGNTSFLVAAFGEVSWVRNLLSPILSGKPHDTRFFVC